jgi:uncharacterized protein (DUF2062 family)
MTGKTMIHMKKVGRFLAHIPGIGMKTLLANIFVTVLAGHLTMG